MAASPSPYAERPMSPGQIKKVSQPPASTARTQPPARLASIDAYRGIVMFLMLAEVLELMTLAEAYPTSQWAEWLRFHTTHVDWVGCSLHDMIQPSFSFLVGVSLPFSIVARKSRGATFLSLAGHALVRSVILIALGIILRSLRYDSTNYFFVDTLTQIGLGYFALFLLGNASKVVQISATSLILLSYWALFAYWRLPAGFDLQAVGVPSDWPHLLNGFASHWNKNANPAWWFDTWFMNLFPQRETFQYNSGGYCTLNFVPTLATMTLGLLAGGVLRDVEHGGKKLAVLFASGALLIGAGWALDYYGLCPIVKRVWTPSWVLFSGGICFAILGLLVAVCDLRGWNAWAWPLMIIGANSITAYIMSWTMEEPIKAFLKRHLGERIFFSAGHAWEPVLLGAAVLTCMWLILLWLFRQRIFVRI